MENIRAVHILNQFFGGVGGEDKADVSPVPRKGAVGPGILIGKTTKGEVNVVATVICGDNYGATHLDAAKKEIIEIIESFTPHIVFAGPAFNDGRYGVLCAGVCTAVQETLKIPAVTAMFPENPGAEIFNGDLYIGVTGDSVGQMEQAVKKMTSIGLKLLRGQPVGPALEEGYIPRGLRRNGFAGEIAAERAVSMLIQRLAGGAYETELPVVQFETIQPPAPIKDVTAETIALVTTGGVVPLGNPDKIQVGRSSRYMKYSLAGISDLTSDTHQAIHAGYDTRYTSQDPDRVLPVDVMRELENERVIGRLHDVFYTLAGQGTYVANARRIGAAIAEELFSAGIHAAVITAT